MKKNNFLLRNAILAMILLFVGLTVSAQSWNDMVRWMKSSGKYRLAELAHPYDYANNKVLDYKVDATSSSVIVKVRYEGVMGAYTDTYEIVKGQYRTRTFFRRIRVDEPWDPFCSAFQSIENFSIGYENTYLRSQLSPMYGGEYFKDLSKGEKAACVLYASFMKDYSN